MRPFLDSTDAAADCPELLRRMQRDGYLFIRGLLPRADIEALRLELLGIANEEAWLERDTRVEDGIANPAAFAVEPQDQYRKCYFRMYCRESFHTLPHHPNLTTLFNRMLADEILMHPRIIGRVIFPRGDDTDDFTTPAHQDFPHVQGTPDTFSAWFPLSDCPKNLGSLMVAEGTHVHGVYDFRPAFGAGGLEVVDPLDGRWVGGDFEAGDVLIFHSLTVHKALPNLTDRLRISMDCRYQRLSDPVNRDSLELDGSPLSWEKIYADWKSAEHQYYWRKRNLKIAPFDRSFHERRDELAFACAEGGDRRAVSALERILAYDPNPAKRERAGELLGRLGVART